MSLSAIYARLAAYMRLSQQHADEIVATARPMAQAALGSLRPRVEPLDVVAREVATEAARGGSLIPAWPIRRADSGVTIEFVNDWGALLSGWLALVDMHADAEALIQSGQRQWIGIANDVLQLFVPDPPEGTYSMVRHHALMLVAATVWLGPDSTRRWQAAHTWAAESFLTRSTALWPVIEAAEHGLSDLLSDPRSSKPVPDALAWLDADAEAREAYLSYLAAASLGVAALLDSVAVWTPAHLTRLIYERHPDPDFNHDEIDRFALAVRA